MNEETPTFHSQESSQKGARDGAQVGTRKYTVHVEVSLKQKHPSKLEQYLK
jgi:hypothetical protein